MLASENTALGVFDERRQAESAIVALKEAGFSESDIGVASREWTKQFQNVHVSEQKVAEKGAVGGALIGGGVGAVVGLAGAMLIPGLIPVIAGETLVSMLVGGAAGAAVGAFAGPFIALGFSETEAKEHAQHIAEGKTIVMVYSPDRRGDAQSIMVKNGAYDESMSTSP
jgi:anti-sigma factor RsiW